METNIFLFSNFLKINTFPGQPLLQRSYFFRISNYSKHILFPKNYFFRRRELFKRRDILRVVTLFEKLILRNQFHSFYNWKDSSINHHSFPYVYYDLVGLSNSIILLFLKIANNTFVSIQEVLQMWFSRKLVAIAVSSKKLREMVLANSIVFVVQKVLR